MKKRIVFLPLDTRPCASSFAVEMAEWAGAECIIPSTDESDFFIRPADFEQSMSFLKRELPKADALVLSVDKLCFGSLLASRSQTVSLEEAKRRLVLLRQLCAAFPHVPVYAYSIIMRSSISTLQMSDLDAYHHMTRYSVYSDKANRLQSAAFQKKAQSEKKKIPPAVLSQYELARHRNYEINRMCVELISEQVFCSLLLLQEDCQPFGFHKVEQQKLLQYVDELKCRNVFIQDGADEGGSLCVMKALQDLSDLKLNVEVVYSRGSGGFTARYEDRPFRENVESTCAFLNADQNASAVKTLFIHTPFRGRQLEAGQENEIEDTGLERIAKKIGSLVLSGKEVYLLDVSFANGGGENILQELRKNIPFSRLAGYSAWNTASNSLGTIIAQIVSDTLAGNIQKAFLAQRLLDDFLYQRIIRNTLQEKLRKEGEDPYHLVNVQRAQEMLQQEYKLQAPTWQDLSLGYAYEPSLPWPRTFETAVKIKQKA